MVEGGPAMTGSVDVRITASQMIKNGTWKVEGDTFYLATNSGLIAYSMENGFIPGGSSTRRILKFVLGLDTDLDSFYSEISDSSFAFLADEFRGLAQPAAPSSYQALVEVIAQQQVSFEFAQRSIENLVRIAGRKMGDIYAFPGAERIGGMSIEDLREAKLGYRAAYIKQLTELYLSGKLNLELRNWNVKEALKYLTEFRGIGRWTAELFLAYGLRMNTYPAGDLGLRRGVAKITGKSVREVKEKDVRELLEPYGKWKSLLAFYITCYDRKTEMERKRNGK